MEVEEDSGLEGCVSIDSGNIVGKSGVEEGLGGVWIKKGKSIFMKNNITAREELASVRIINSVGLLTR